jgi:hypothetical protein
MLNVVLKAEDYQDKTLTIETRSPWETVIGTVKIGFPANLSVSALTGCYHQIL